MTKITTLFPISSMEIIIRDITNKINHQTSPNIQTKYDQVGHGPNTTRWLTTYTTYNKKPTHRPEPARINLYTIHLYPTHIQIRHHLAKTIHRTTINYNDPQLTTKLPTTIQTILKAHIHQITPISSKETCPPPSTSNKSSKTSLINAQTSPSPQ